MLSELQTRKLTRLFDLYDLDNDGILSHADYIQAAANLARMRGHAEGTAEYKALQDAFMAVWMRLKRGADADHDQKVSLREFLVRYDVMLRQPEVVESIIILLAQLFAQIADADGNGRVEQDEFVAAMAAYDVAVEEAEKAFTYLDRTGDNTITWDELLMNVREFLCGNDEKAPGNWLFGKI